MRKSTNRGEQFADERIFPRRIGRTKGGLNTKLHAICDGEGRPIIMCLTAGQRSDHIGAKTLYPALPEGGNRVLLGDKGYDSDQYRAALGAKGIASCIPPRKGRKAPAKYCKTLYKQQLDLLNRIIILILMLSVMTLSFPNFFIPLCVSGMRK